MTVRRHPIRGLIGGLVLGIGIGLILMLTSLPVFGEATVIIAIVAGGLLGLLVAVALPARSGPRS